MRYTPSQIKAEGGRRFLKRNKKRVAILLLASSTWVPVAVLFVNGNSVFRDYAVYIKMFIYLAAPILVGTNLFLSYKQSVKMFYEKVRKNPELLQ